MSKCTPKSDSFINDCERITKEFLEVENVKCWYDADLEHPWTKKRDYCLTAEHNTKDINWDRKIYQTLQNKLDEIGASNIMGKFTRSCIELKFDIKKSRLKSDMNKTE